MVTAGSVGLPTDLGKKTFRIAKTMNLALEIDEASED